MSPSLLPPARWLAYYLQSVQTSPLGGPGAPYVQFTFKASMAASICIVTIPSKNGGYVWATAI